MFHRYLIINADDAGKSSIVNKAIIDCFEKNLISSSTIIANMEAFTEACELIFKNNIHNKIGVHLNLVEGKPLTTGIKKIKYLCDSKGCFHGKSMSILGSFIRISKSEYRIIKHELRTQIELCRSKGLILTHIDSHWHRHLNWIIGRMVIELAKQYDIKFIRQRGLISSKRKLKEKLYGYFYNKRLKFYGCQSTGEIYDLKSFVENPPSLNGITETIVHPTYLNGVLVDAEHLYDLEKVLGPYQDLKKISFADLVQIRKSI